MRGKKIVAWALSAIMAVAPLSACAQKPAGSGDAGGEAEEEMDRDVESADGETIISVDANDEGVYAVTITEENLKEDQDLAEEIDEIVTAEEAGVGTEEEMSRSDVEVVEDADGDEVELAEEAAEDEDAAADEVVEDELAEEIEPAADAEPAEAEPDEEVELADEAEPGEWSLASVRQEDVVVSYNVPVEAAEGEEPQYETHQAEVTDFSNDDGTLALTFQGEAGATDFTVNTYTVRFAGTESYAVVHVVPADNGVVVESVDYDALAAELAEYEPGFTQEDISNPEGTYFEDGELVVTEDAPEAVQDALVESGFAEDEMSRADGDNGNADNDDARGQAEANNNADNDDARGQAEANNNADNDDARGQAEANNANNGNANNNANANNGNAGGDAGNNANDNAGGNASANSDSTGNATIEYMQKCKETEWDYENYDALAQYVPEVLSEIDPKAGKVAELGADAYRIFRGFYRNEWSYIAEGGLGILKIFGLFKGGGASGVSNEQILSEVQKVGIEVTEMHCLTKAMKAELNENLRATYENSLQIFDNSINSLHANAEVVQNMLTQGAIRAAEDGIEPPAEDCTAEEEYEYNYDLVEYIEKLEAAGGRKNSAFKGFTKHAQNLTDDFVLVAGEVGDQNRQGPVVTFDKYWNLYFNYDTEGYYLRQSYRANIEYELKRAFGLIEVYYNVFDPETAGNYDSYNTLLWKALDRMEGQDAGANPADPNFLYVKNYNTDYWYTSKPVRCNTFDKSIAYVQVNYTQNGNSVGSDVLEEYVQRLHGRSVEDDLDLAGLGRVARKDLRWFKGNTYKYENCTHGIAFNAKYDWKTDKGVADIIAFGSGQIVKQQTTYLGIKDFAVFDDDAKHYEMEFVWLELE